VAEATTKKINTWTGRTLSPRAIELPKAQRAVVVARVGQSGFSNASKWPKAVSSKGLCIDHLR